jgi:hypothetical protein
MLKAFDARLSNIHHQTLRVTEKELQSSFIAHNKPGKVRGKAFECFSENYIPQNNLPYRCIHQLAF